MEEWEKHFSQLLEGSKNGEREIADKRKVEGDQEEDLKDEEIEEQIRRLKKKKAAGVDEIGSEAWIYSDGQIRKGLKEVLKSVWRGEGFPEEWKKGLIAPIEERRNKRRYKL